VKITNEIIDHIAHLARLEFNGDDKEEIQSDMEKIISFMDELKKVKTDDIKPLVSVSENNNILREDMAIKTIGKAEAFANAPKKDSDYFRIPKVLKK
tara:strand:+ start:1688 stop:1978 length:291 start_codon:yes stop_codon:yes gene_type:complete